MHITNNTISQSTNKMKNCKYHVLIRNLEDEDNDVLDDTFPSKEIAKEHILKILREKMSECQDSSIQGTVDPHEDEDEDGNPIDILEQRFTTLDEIALWFDTYNNAAILVEIKSRKIEFTYELSFGYA